MVRDARAPVQRGGGGRASKPAESFAAVRAWGAAKTKRQIASR